MFGTQTVHSKQRRTVKPVLYSDGAPSWINDLKLNYNVTSLVDVNGKEINTDFADQADMCEIIRF